MSLLETTNCQRFGLKTTCDISIVSFFWRWKMQVFWRCEGNIYLDSVCRPVVCRSGEEVFWRGICRLHAHHAWVLVGLNVDIVFLSVFHFLMRTNTCWHLLKKSVVYSHPVILPTWAHVSLQFCLSWLLVCCVTLSRFYCRITNAKLRVQQRVIQDGIKNKVTYEGTVLDPTNKPGAETSSRPSWPPGLKCLPLLVRAERRREDTVGVLQRLNIRFFFFVVDWWTSSAQMMEGTKLFLVCCFVFVDKSKPLDLKIRSIITPWNTEGDDLQLGSPPWTKQETLWLCGIHKLPRCQVCC